MQQREKTRIWFEIYFNYPFRQHSDMYMDFFFYYDFFILKHGNTTYEQSMDETGVGMALDLDHVQSIYVINKYECILQIASKDVAAPYIILLVILTLISILRYVDCFTMCRILSLVYLLPGVLYPECFQQTYLYVNINVYSIN